MAKQRADPLAITTRRYHPFLTSPAATRTGHVCAVRPDVSVLVALEHADYILRAIRLLTDATSSETFNSSPEQQDAMMGIDYLVQLAAGLVGSVVDSMDAITSRP